jgi:hypothetical protein
VVKIPLGIGAKFCVLLIAHLIHVYPISSTSSSMFSWIHSSHISPSDGFQYNLVSEIEAKGVVKVNDNGRRKSVCI